MGKLLHDNKGKEYVAITKKDLDFSFRFYDDECGLSTHPCTFPIDVLIKICIAHLIVQTLPSNVWYIVRDVLVAYDTHGEKYLLLRTELAGIPCERLDVAISYDDYIFVG